MLENLGDLPLAAVIALPLLDGHAAQLETEREVHDLEALVLEAHPCRQGQIATFLGGIPHAVGREVLEVIVTEESDPGRERAHEDENELDRPLEDHHLLDVVCQEEGLLFGVIDTRGDLQFEEAGCETVTTTEIGFATGRWIEIECEIEKGTVISSVVMIGEHPSEQIH